MRNVFRKKEWAAKETVYCVEFSFVIGETVTKLL